MSITGIDKSELDPSVRPQDDLYRHVNGRWIERTEIPADKARYGAFAVLAENAESAVQDIITGKITGFDSAQDQQDLKKIRALYESFMDEQRLRELGAEPLQQDLQRVLQAQSVSDFVRLTARFDTAGVAGLVSMFIDNDPGDPQRYVLFLVQSGLGLPDESYYRESEYEQIRAKYLAHIERMFELVGVDNAADRAASVLQLETEIASQHWDRVASRDIQKTYNQHITW